MHELHLRLHFMGDSHVENHVFQFKDYVSQDLFRELEVFKHKPIRISFDTNDFEKSFVPSTMVLMRLTENNMIITRICQESMLVSCLSNNSADLPVDVFVHDDQGKFYMYE